MKDKPPIIDQKNLLSTINQVGNEISAVERELRDGHYKLSRDRRKRLSEVRRMYFVEKLTQVEIAEKLGLAEITIKKDMRLLRDQANAEASGDNTLKADMLAFVWEINENYKERIRRLWADYKASTNEFVRVKMLGEIREQEKQYVSFLQQFGIVTKEPDKVLHGIQYISHLGKPRETVDEQKQEDSPDEHETAARTAAVPLH